MRQSVRLKYLDPIGKFASGNVRYYYRRLGNRVAMPDLPPDHPKFIAAYSIAHGSTPRTPVVSGTIAAGTEAYFASDQFLMKRASTRDQRRRIAEKIKTTRGRGSLATLEPWHIRSDISDFRAHAAINRWKVWRALGKFWLTKGLLKSNPAAAVERPEAPKANPYKSWTRDDFARFREYWAVGTPERWALELAYQSCASSVDLVALGPANVSDGFLGYNRSKTGSRAESPLAAVPLWFEVSPSYHACIRLAPKHMTYLTTKAGTSRSSKAVSSWFSRKCTDAGLPDHSLHGIRHGRASIFKENGATKDQRMAVLGHESEAESNHYSKSADLRRVINQ